MCSSPELPQQNVVAKQIRKWNNREQHTLHHEDCPACLAVNERIMFLDSAIGTMSVKKAGERWIEWRRPYVSGRTVETYENWLVALDRFFGQLALAKILPGHMREYQRMRQANSDSMWKRAAGPSSINHELNTLAQILEFAGLWQPIKPYYKPLPLPRWTPPRVLTPEQEQVLFETAASDPDLELAYYAASITNNTTASGCELRALQLMHINLLSRPPEIIIPADRVKNEHRGRRIPLNATAAKQVERCVLRAARLGSKDREHYLFPFRVARNRYDPIRPASRFFLRAQFEKLRSRAGMPWLRPHDLRHQAVTRMLESGAPEMTVMSIAGHVSRQMLNHYSHTRMDAKMAVVNAIEPRDFRVAEGRRTA